MRHNRFLIISLVLIFFAFAPSILADHEPGHAADAAGVAGAAGAAGAGGAAGVAAGTVAAAPNAPECPDFVKDEVRKILSEPASDGTPPFAEFMTTHFRNDAPSSTLLPQAIDRFKIFATTLYSIVDKAPPELQGSCRTYVSSILAAYKQIFKMHVTANAQGKKATNLINSYKEINSKLEELNFKVAQMYGYFLTFSKKLPCYAKECVK